MFLASRVLWLAFVAVMVSILALFFQVAYLITRHPLWFAALYALVDAVVFNIELSLRRKEYPWPPEPPEPPPGRRFFLMSPSYSAALRIGSRRRSTPARFQSRGRDQAR